MREGVRAAGSGREGKGSERRTDLLAERADGARGLAAGAEGEAFVVGVRVGQEVAVPGGEACARPDGSVSLVDSAVKETRRAHWLASSRLSMGLTKSGLQERHAAMVRIGPRQRKTVPRISIWRRHGVKF